ncbi:hypothetical protein [Mangrovicoccus ximenensis]|nr:hypothetical protein [Mangrovicoccus ximenensis]
MTHTGAQPMTRLAPMPVPQTWDAGNRSFLTLPSLEALLDWLETHK